MNKTKKIYESPTCETISPDTENLMGFGLHGSEVAEDSDGNPIIGAKQGQLLFDDEVEENPSYDL